MTEQEIEAFEKRVAVQARTFVLEGLPPALAERRARAYELRQLSSQTEFMAEMDRRARNGDDRP